MNTFPLELIDQISSFLDVDDLKRTLFVSRTFQAAAERYSGAFTAFDFGYDDDDCQKFLSTYSGRRLSYLRYIEIHINFPTLQPWDIDPREITCRESRIELQVKDELFTEQVARVFRTIKKAESRAGHAHYSPGRVHLMLLTPVRWVHKSFCLHRLSSAWRVHLLRPEELPELASVRSLSVCNPEVRPRAFDDNHALSRLDWRVVIDMASKFPNLEYLGCELGIGEGRHQNDDVGRKHYEHDYECCARDSRLDFAKALEKAVLSPSLKSVQMDFLKEFYEHVKEERGGGPDLVHPAPYDLFSTTLCTFASSLRQLKLRLKCDSTLFWSPYGSISFPNLEDLNVMFHPITPSGSWYFRGPAGEGENDVGYAVTENMYPPLEDSALDEAWDHEIVLPYPIFEDRFRIVPNEQTLYPFLEAFVKAVSTMHRLKSASLWSPLSFSDWAWGVSYYTQGKFFNEPNKVNARRLYWSVAEWRPPPTLHKLFQEIGCAEHNEQLLEYWNVYGGGDDEFDTYDIFETDLSSFTEGYYPGWRFNKCAEHPKDFSRKDLRRRCRH